MKYDEKAIAELQKELGGRGIWDVIDWAKAQAKAGAYEIRYYCDGAFYYFVTPNERRLDMDDLIADYRKRG